MIKILQKIYTFILCGKHQPTKLQEALAINGIIFNEAPVYKAAHHLSDAEQIALAKLISEYIYGYTVTVYDTYGFMKWAVKCFKTMKPPFDQDEFDELMGCP